MPYNFIINKISRLYPVATQDGPEKIVQNVCHFQAATGKMDTAINPWNVNASPDITETFVNMQIVLMDVILTMVIVFVLILAGVTQVLFDMCRFLMLIGVYRIVC